MAVPISNGDSIIRAHMANKNVERTFPCRQMKCVKHLSVALAEFLHFMLLTHLQELGHSVDARFIGLWRQCIIDACLQIGFAGFCRQSFGDKYYVYAWKPLVEAGDVKAILFCVGLLVKGWMCYTVRGCRL